MGLGSISIRPLESDVDIEKELALMRIAFPGEGVDELATRLLSNHPGFNRSSFIGAWDGEALVASLCLIPLTWSLGDVPLKIAEMGLVATHPAYRNKGIQRSLNAVYDDITVAEDYDLSVIEGIPYFYRQFGYEYTVPLDSEATIPLEKLPVGPKGIVARFFTQSDIASAMRMLEESQARLLVHSIRSEEEWEVQNRTRWHGEKRFDGYVLEIEDTTVAYLRVGRQEDRLYLLEASGIGMAFTKPILGFLRKLGDSEGRKTLVSRLGPGEAVTREIVAAGGELNRPYGWQVKVINIRKFLDRLRPLMSRRLNRSRYSGFSDILTFNLYRDCFALRIERGDVTSVEEYSMGGDGLLINPIVFPKLLLGVRNVGELMREYHDVFVAKQHIDLLDTLFPKGESYIHTTY